MSDIKVDRLVSPIRYYGGKGLRISKILKFIPNHKVYVEPYFGGGSVFFAKEPSPVEVVNDINEELINMYRVLQDKEMFNELRHRLMYTPYARSEFIRALNMPEDSSCIDRAWATIVLYNMSFSGVRGTTQGKWGRTFTQSNGLCSTVNTWLKRLAALDAIHWRIMMAQIDNRDALEVIKYWDSDDTLFYIDPPYHSQTRKDKIMYVNEVDDEHHAQLVDTLLKVRGKVLLSCYYHQVYEPLLLAGWEKHEFHTSCNAAARTRSSKLRGKGSAKKFVPRTDLLIIKR